MLANVASCYLLLLVLALVDISEQIVGFCGEKECVDTADLCCDAVG